MGRLGDCNNPSVTAFAVPPPLAQGRLWMRSFLLVFQELENIGFGAVAQGLLDGLAVFHDH